MYHTDMYLPWRFALFGMLVLAPFSDAAFGQAKNEKAEFQLQRSNVIRRSTPFAPPERISARSDEPTKREVSVDLNVDFAVVQVDCPVSGGTIERHRLRVRTYNGKMTAPEIRTAPGDLLRVRLFNRIPRNEPDKPYSPNKPNGFNITNLHTHGLHVSPEGRSDNVYLEVGPEEGIGLCFDIPPLHRPGTHWFHAHRHGSTALQLSSGMAGALIVDPGSEPSLDDVTEIKQAMADGREKVLVFQQLKYTINPQTQIGEVTEKDVYENTPQHRVTLINGTYAPLIEMRPREVQRWRCIHGGLDSELNLGIVNSDGQAPWDLHEIARDGLPLYEINRTKNVLLYPGYRSDFLVEAPAEEGEYVLTNVPVSPELAFRKVAASNAGAFRRVPLGEQSFARICVKGAPLPMALPKLGVIGKYAPPEITDDELYSRLPYQLEFAVDVQSATINGQQFDPTREDVCPRLGTAEEWTLTAANDKHPFHIHVNPFMVVKKDGNGQVTSRYWKDTILVDGDQVDPRTHVRMRFEDFTGKTVLHCHNLEHEDRGMMMVVKIVGQSKLVSRCDPKRTVSPILPGTKPPGWSLQDEPGQIHRFADMNGQRHLLIFFRGLGCSHCRGQLDELASQQDALVEAGIKVVAVSPDSREMMKSVLASDEVVRSMPFLMLSDPTLGTFKQYGCFDGRALHGTFLVDASGVVQWQYVGDEPYTDVEGLLSKCRQLGPERRP